ncbi:hypothetical protein [Atopomonas hussainii]|nr:hypothetical protein [Atopomonas hussainii]
MSHVLLFIGFLLIFVLGTHGYIGESFSQSTDAQVFSFLSSVVVGAWLAASPRNKSIVISESGIEIPRILLPPYNTSKICWHDLYAAETKINQNGTYAVILKSKKQTLKIESWLCLGDFELAMYPDAFYELETAIEVFRHEHRASRLKQVK